MKKLFGAALVTLCLLPINASAWTRYGGGWSCGMVTEMKDDAAYKAQFQAWSMGYITALNELTQTELQNPPDQYGIWQAILLHCENNPLHDLYTASANVAVQIIQKQQ